MSAPRGEDDSDGGLGVKIGTSVKFEMPLYNQLIRFGLVGSLGFIIDSSILAALVHVAGWNPLAARVVSIAVAVLATWRLHRHWTFAAGSERPPISQSVMYASFQLVTVSLNYLIFSVLVLSGGIWRAHPVLAVAVAAVACMGFNYLLSRHITFASPRKSAPQVQERALV
jgi:putative flippase GtrA